MLKTKPKVPIESRLKLFRHLMWDYSIPAEEIEAVFRGGKERAGHYSRQALMVKLLESYSWFTILELFSTRELMELITVDVIMKLRSQSLRNQYEYVQKRLQQLVQDAG